MRPNIVHQDIPKYIWQLVETIHQLEYTRKHKAAIPERGGVLAPWGDPANEGIHSPCRWADGAVTGTGSWDSSKSGLGIFINSHFDSGNIEVQSLWSRLQSWVALLPGIFASAPRGAIIHYWSASIAQVVDISDSSNIKLRCAAA